MSLAHFLQNVVLVLQTVILGWAVESVSSVPSVL